VTQPPGEAPQYAFRASLIGSAHAFSLTDDGLSWQIGSRSGVWRYSDIADIRLSYRPISMQSRRFRADLRHRNGSRLSVLSTTWQTATLMAPQDTGYRTFIVDLHRRLAQHGARTSLAGGLKPMLYWPGAGLIALVAAAMAGLLVRALVVGEWAGALFVVGFAALFGWQIGNFMWRNRPRAYTFDAVPGDLLP
jgi:hypothetical protein